jgi:DNA-binding transcriptional regulator/RsmH inhibitor MraZ
MRASNRSTRSREERDAFTTAILGGSVQLGFDGEGRVVLPEALLKKAASPDTGIFVGKGATFEIWSPQLFAETGCAYARAWRWLSAST